MVTSQAILFLIFIIIGIIIGVLFDIFRISRKTFNTSDIVTYIEDIFFWILVGCIILFAVFKFNNGEIRMFMFLAIILGCIAYMLLLSKFIINASVKILNKLMKIIKKTIQILTIPIFSIIAIFKKLFSKPILFIIINFKKLYSNILLKIKRKFKVSRQKKTLNIRKT